MISLLLFLTLFRVLNSASLNRVCSTHSLDCSIQSGFEHDGVLYKGNVSSLLSDSYTRFPDVQTYIKDQKCVKAGWFGDARMSIDMGESFRQRVVDHSYIFKSKPAGYFWESLFDDKVSSLDSTGFELPKRLVLMEGASSVFISNVYLHPRFTYKLSSSAEVTNIKITMSEFSSSGSSVVPIFVPSRLLVLKFYAETVSLLSTSTHFKVVAPKIVYDTGFLSVVNPYYSALVNRPKSVSFECDGTLIFIRDDRVHFSIGDEREADNECPQYLVEVHEGDLQAQFHYPVSHKITVAPWFSNGLCFTGSANNELHILPSYPTKNDFTFSPMFAYDQPCTCAGPEFNTKTTLSSGCLYSLHLSAKYEVAEYAHKVSIAMAISCLKTDLCVFHKDYPTSGYFESEDYPTYPQDAVYPLTSTNPNVAPIKYLIFAGSVSISRFLESEFPVCACSSGHHTKDVLHVSLPNLSQSKLVPTHCGQTTSHIVLDSEVHLPPYGVAGAPCLRRALSAWTLLKHACMIICFGEEATSGVSADQFKKYQNEVKTSFTQVNVQLVKQHTFDSKVAVSLKTTTSNFNSFSAQTNQNLLKIQVEVTSVRRSLNHLSDASYNQSIVLAVHQLQLQTLVHVRTDDDERLSKVSSDILPIKSGCVYLDPPRHLTGDQSLNLDDYKLDEFTATPPNGTVSVPKEVEATDDSSGLPLWAILVIIGAVLVALVVLYCVYTKRSKSRV